jgi:hypothetical protein
VAKKKIVERKKIVGRKIRFKIIKAWVGKFEP